MKKSIKSLFVLLFASLLFMSFAPANLNSKASLRCAENSDSSEQIPSRSMVECADEFACNYDPEATENTECDYISCVEIDVEITIVEDCEIATVEFVVNSITPENAELTYAINSGLQTPIILGEQYDLEFLQEGTNELSFNVIISPEQEFSLPIQEEMVNVYEIPLTPEIQLISNELSCVECIGEFEYLWFVDGINGPVSTEETLPIVDWDLIYELCIFDGIEDCIACSGAFNPLSIKENIEAQAVVFDNGIAPSILFPSNGLYQFVDVAGRVLKSGQVDQGEFIPTHDLSDGVYFVIFNQSTVKLIKRSN